MRNWTSSIVIGVCALGASFAFQSVSPSAAHADVILADGPYYHLLQLSVENDAKIETLFAEATQQIRSCDDARRFNEAFPAEVTVVENDKVTLYQLPQGLAEIIATIIVGQATPPFGDGETLRVLIVCARPETVVGPALDPDQ